MKKPPISNGLFPRNLKFDLKMKLTLLFFVTLSFVMQAGTTYSQKTKISLNKENVMVKEVIDEIETTTEFKFLFNTNAVDLNRKVSVNVKKVSINVILDLLFKGEKTTYEIDNRKILLTKVKESKSIMMNMPNPYGLISNQIKGKITDSNGQPLPGVNIIEKGTANSVTTDSNGNYLIEVKDKNSVLVVSFIGYVDQEIAVGTLSTINIKMESDSKKLDEVVVVGYGSKKKVNLTGSVSTVSGASLTKRPVANAATMLQGLLPGVRVSQSSGQPGQGNVNIQVRGFGTFSGAGVNPLILVDGVQGNMEDLNPNVIESVTVLKDAASAAIYGSRAANGVILVTTKNGANSTGAIKIGYDFNYGSSTPTKLLDLVTNSPDYMRAWNTYIKNQNYGVDIPSKQYTAQDIANYTNPSDPIKYPSFDWQRFIIKAAPSSMHNLSVSGGKQTRYYVSLGVADQKGTMEAFNYKRYNAQVNIVSNVSERFKFGTNIGLKSATTIADASGQENYFICLLSQPSTAMPTIPGHPELYSWRAFPFESNNWNPYQQLKENSATTKDYALTSQIWADLEITKGLHWYTKAAANYATSQYTKFSPNTGYLRLYSDPTVLGYNYSVSSLTKQNTQNLYTNLYSYLTYEKTLGLHNFNLVAGYSNENNDLESIGAYRAGYVSPSTPSLNAGDANGQTNNGVTNSWAIQSFFSRLSYNYDGKYFVEANLRSDGTSRLASGSRWGSFPSISAGWKFSEEQFMESTRSWLSNAKLRASWGRLGNQNIGNYPYQALLSLTGAYPYNGTSLSPGVAQTALNNPDIRWEETTSSNLGLDVTLFKKLSFSLDVYKKKTTDILRPAQITGTVGLNGPIVNNGVIQNTGFDFDISYNDRITSGALEGFSFGGGFNISAFKNKLITFGAPQDNGMSIDKEGLPWNSFYLLQVKGIFQTAEQIAAAPKQFGENTQPGMIQYEDANGDGKIDNDDRVVTKGAFPSFTYGFNLNAAWKGFDLYCFFQGVAGSKVFANGWGVEPFIQGTSPTKDQANNAWTPENHSPNVTMLGNPTDYTHPSTYTLFDNSYLRLKTLQIGYTLPVEYSNKIGMSKLRVYLSGDNLLTFTKYPGLDPERSQPANYYGWYPYCNYPQNKVLSFGCNLTFN